MQPGRAPTSGLGVLPLMLARCVGWVPPLHPICGVWIVVTCPSAALVMQECAVSLSAWRLFTGVHTRFLDLPSTSAYG